MLTLPDIKPPVTLTFPSELEVLWEDVLLFPVSKIGLRKGNREKNIIAGFVRKRDFFTFFSAAITFGTERERMQRHAIIATAFMKVFLRISTSFKVAYAL